MTNRKDRPSTRGGSLDGSFSMNSPHHTLPSKESIELALGYTDAGVEGKISEMISELQSRDRRIDELEQEILHWRQMELKWMAREAEFKLREAELQKQNENVEKRWNMEKAALQRRNENLEKRVRDATIAVASQVS